MDLIVSQRVINPLYDSLLEKKVFTVLYKIFFSTKGSKMDLIATQGAIKCTLWITSKKNYYFINEAVTCNWSRQTLSQGPEEKLDWQPKKLVLLVKV